MRCQSSSEEALVVLVGQARVGEQVAVAGIVEAFHLAAGCRSARSGASLRSRSSDSGYGANYRTGWRLLGLFR